MSLFRIGRALGSIDLKSVYRDPLLVWLSGFTLAFACIIRWGTPWATEALLRRYEFDLVEYYPLMLSFVALTVPGMVGAIIAFLLLDQRDDGTLVALSVTPMTFRKYLIYRTGVPIVASVVLTGIALTLSGLMTAGWHVALLASVVASLFVPIYALFITCLAANKVQGFAVMKGAGVLALPAVVAWFVPMPWQVALGVVPHYWIAKVVWVMEAGDSPWPFVMTALVFQVVLLRLLLRRFVRTRL